MWTMHSEFVLCFKYSTMWAHWPRAAFTNVQKEPEIPTNIEYIKIHEDNRTVSMGTFSIWTYTRKHDCRSMRRNALANDFWQCVCANPPAKKTWNGWVIHGTCNTQHWLMHQKSFSVKLKDLKQKRKSFWDGLNLSDGSLALSGFKWTWGNL